NYTSVSRNKLKLLFVGGLSQRKGIAELFNSIEALKPYVNLTVVGKKPTNSCAILNENLSRHRWFPTLPHSDILKLMKAHDVLLFPSLFEGFGLVITEAMSQGTPVITTDRTAGPDLIINAENGWLVEAGSAMALQNSIENLLLRPSLIATTGKEAMETARLRPWKVYGRELSRAITAHFEGNLISTR
ncbi:MAG TPA: glycosyltransferase family 4 protein, partial [Gillisia sp.]|nr:glycosyltransferase family 4 protein [Gillisia sp.]